MPRRWVALSVLVTLTAAGIACGGSTPPAPTAVPKPTPTERPLPAPTEKPLPEPTETPLPTPTETPLPEPTETPPPIPTETPQIDPQEADAIRQLAFAFWEAYNTYDANRALRYLVQDYRRQQEDSIRNNIGRMKSFRAKLGVSEAGPPQIIKNDEREMYISMKTPLGERRVHMVFRKISGEWKIALSEEVE